MTLNITDLWNTTKNSTTSNETKNQTRMATTLETYGSSNPASLLIEARESQSAAV